MNKGKISLCIICGNVAEYIERCLTSFIPVADEVCIVRAIGNNTPDRTEQIAREVCEMHRVPLKFAEYKNKPEHADWPHVDSFCAARQMSFDLATSEFAMWVDSDDVLESGAQLIREHAAKGEYSCFMFPYKIFGTGICLPRERLVRKSECWWVHRVHECLHFRNAPIPAGQDEWVVITHLPKPEREGSHPRNLRILESIPEDELTTGEMFHLNEELLIANRFDEAIKVAEKTLARPDLGRPEKMELLINLAAATKDDPDMVEALLYQAYAADPRRREALARLCHHMLNYEHGDFALAFARQMLSIPDPPVEKRPWNHNAALYGWLGEDLYAESLRLNGNYMAAEDVRVSQIQKYGRPRISLIHATRGRPRKAAMARKAWLELAVRPELIEHIFIVDSDDKTSAMLRRFRHMAIPAGGGCVDAWNSGLFATIAPVVIQMSDDWVPPQKWDELILEKLGDVDAPKVLAVSDGARNDALLCMAICTRAYTNQDYFLFHPWFTGVYSDNWFTEQAYKRGHVIEAKDLVFTHNHPCFGKAEVDETYQRQNAPERYAEGEKVLKQLQAGNDWSSVPGYFNYWPLYRFIAQRVKDGDTLCEIGTWLGRSIIYLAQELQRQGKGNCKLIAVDTFKGEEGEAEHAPTVARFGGSIRGEFERNLERCGVRHMVTILEGKSWEMAAAVEDGELAFCYVDAAHDYTSVRNDVSAWKPKVKKGGMIAGHDAQWREVTDAAKEVLGEIEISGGVWTREMV